MSTPNTLKSSFCSKTLHLILLVFASFQAANAGITGHFYPPEPVVQPEKNESHLILQSHTEPEIRDAIGPFYPDRQKETNSSECIPGTRESSPEQSKRLQSPRTDNRSVILRLPRKLPRAIPAAQFADSGVTVSKDGRWIASAWQKQRIISLHRVDQPDTRHLLNHTYCLSEPVKYIARVWVSPDNKAVSLVMGTPSGHTLGIVDLATMSFRVPASLQGLTVHSESGDFSPDGSLICSHIPRNGELQIIDWRRDSVVHRELTEDSQFYSVGFTPEGTLLCTSREYVYHIDPYNQRLLEQHYFPCPQKGKYADLDDSLRRANISSGGTRILASKYFGLRVYSPGGAVAQFDMTFGGPPEMVTSLVQRFNLFVL